MYCSNLLIWYEQVNYDFCPTCPIWLANTFFLV